MALEKGNKAPDFTANANGGKEITLSDYHGKWVVLYFYPKDNTSGCTKEACSFRDNLSELTNHGAVVLGVSKDSVKSHENFIAKHELNFDLISDTEQEILKLYDVLGEKKMYGKTYMGTIRTTYLIDPEGTIQEVWNKVKVAGHTEEVIKKLEELKG
jgi:peroxiredoxin Q/BCP